MLQITIKNKTIIVPDEMASDLINREMKRVAREIRLKEWQARRYNFLQKIKDKQRKF